MNPIYRRMPYRSMSRSICTCKNQSTSNINQINPKASYNVPVPNKRMHRWSNIQNNEVYKKSKTIMKKYAYIFIPIHVVITITCICISYCVISSGGTNVVRNLEDMNVDEESIKPFRDSKLTTVTQIFLLLKLTMPIRYIISLAITTICVKTWKYFKKNKR